MKEESIKLTIEVPFDKITLGTHSLIVRLYECNQFLFTPDIKEPFYILEDRFSLRESNHSSMIYNIPEAFIKEINNKASTELTKGTVKGVYKTYCKNNNVDISFHEFLALMGEE